MLTHISLPKRVRWSNILTSCSFLAFTPAESLRAQVAHEAHAPAHYAAGTTPVPLLRNLGRWHRRVATHDPRAQKYFDQGLRLYYAFNHAEAVRSFREAQRLDPKCVMCVWGEAIAFGPNINAPMDAVAERQAIAATDRAREMIVKSKASELEVALVLALVSRYSPTALSTRASRDSAYAKAMAILAEVVPTDVDVQALAAEAAMNLSPWNYWEKDKTPRQGTLRMLAWLERSLKAIPDHPGACHFYIHAVEAAFPDRAVACAERLASLMPGAGHIVHMPAHIYIRVGRWADAIESNQHAVHADAQYMDGPHTSESGFYAAAYVSHNHHFLTLAAVMAGASQTAIAASRQVTAIITPELARQVPLVEPLLAVPVQTLVSFGRWEEVLRSPLPPSDLRVASGHAWYARGIAFAATARFTEASATADSIRGVARSLPEGEIRATMDIAALLVDGEIALRRRETSRAIALFSAAKVLEDGLSYMEPPTWYYPVRHSLGKALLAADRANEAEHVYREDLQRFPENGWSLRGLALALSAQKRTREAQVVLDRFAKAWRRADVTISASRY